jgi:sugar phosphate permease
VSNWLGWRAAFVGIGAVTLILAICIWALVRDRPEDMGFPPLLDAYAPDGQAGQSLLYGVNRVLSEKYFWPLAIRNFFGYGTIMGLGGLWGGPYLIDVYGLSKTQAANVLTMIPIGMILGGPFLGWLSDRVFRARKPVMVWGMFIYLLAWVPLSFWTAQIHPLMLYLVTFVMGLTGCSLMAVNFTAVKELFPKEMAGTATGMANVFPFAGGAVFPPIMGYIMDSAARTGGGYSLVAYRAAFTFCLICSAVSFFSVCLMKETLGKGDARS